MNAYDLARLAGVPLKPEPPQLVPEEDLRLIISALMEALQAARCDFTRYDRTGALRRQYERFACVLRSSGFRIEETLTRTERASRERRLAELAEQRGDVDAAIVHYERAVRSWRAVGCRRRLAWLRRHEPETACGHPPI